MSPTVHIDAPPDPILRGQPLKCTATASDPDGDAVTLQWVWTAGACTTLPTDGWNPGKELDLTPNETDAPFCVWVKASDRYGATAVDSLFGDPQDQAPVAALDLVSPADAQSFAPHTMFTLSAAATQDPDDPQASVDFAWSVTALSMAKVDFVDCPTPPTKTVRCFLADFADDFQVEVRATDTAMKTSTARKTLHVVPGQLPVAHVALVSVVMASSGLSFPTAVGPYPLGATFRVSGATSIGDGTTLSYDWRGSTASLTSCGDSSGGAVQCFTADKEGTYTVSLTVTDSAGQSAPVSVAYVVAPDQPPCIDQTTPGVGGLVTTMTTFDVDVVFDDLDPFPFPSPFTNMLSMQWFVTDDAGTFLPREIGFPNLTLNPSGLSFGENVRVRVEVQDRDTTRSQNAFLACGDQDFCSLPNLVHPTTCFQRVTWTLNVLP